MAKSTFASVIFFRADGVDVAGQAEVHDLDLLPRRVGVDDHQVGRLQVAVDDAAVVGGLQGFAQLAEQPADAGRREPAVPLQERVQVDAPDVLHDDARALRIVEREVVERDGVGMLKFAHQLDFALEPLAELDVGGDVVVHDLDDDLAVRQVELAGEENAAHAALAEQAGGFVATEKDAADHVRNPVQVTW